MKKLQLSISKISETTRDNQEAVAIKNKRLLYTNFYIAAQVRDVDLHILFELKQKYRHSLSEFGKIHIGTNKADFLSFSEVASDVIYTPPDDDSHVIDGAALFQKTQPAFSKRYLKYCKNEIGTKIESFSKRFQRNDLVVDLYRDYKKWSTMRVYAFRLEKTYRYGMISKVVKRWTKQNRIILINSKQHCLLVATNMVKRLSNFSDIYINLQSCDYEEAHTRITAHVKDILVQGYEKVSIITLDKDNLG